MKNEVVQLIEKYESVLSHLKAENMKLKGELPSPKMFTRSGIKGGGSLNETEAISPIKKGTIDLMQTAKSNVLQPFPSDNKLGEIKLSSIMTKRQNNDDFNFPVELIGEEEAWPVPRVNTSRY